MWTFLTQRRYILAILALLGFFNAYALRVNLSIAIVVMTELKNITLTNGTTVQEREFDWDSKLQGYVLSSFFYGYITTQLIGGFLAARIGGRKVFGLGIGVTAVLTLITPWIATVNVYLLLALRIVEGVFEGVTYPCLHEMWSHWAPPTERSRLTTIAFSGSFLGTVVSMPLCSLFASTWGWPSIFYIFGSLGLIWFFIWWFVTSDTPAEDQKISKEELQYITESLSNTDPKVKRKIPWTSIIQSWPVWAITVSHFCENWGFYTLLTQLPKFMRNYLKFDLTLTGVMSGIPYFLMGVMLQFVGHIADFFITRKILTVTQVRKALNCSGFLSQTVFIMISAYWFSQIGTTFCLTMAVGLGAFAWGGFSMNHLDIAPQYAGILMGFGNTFATIPGIVSPIICGYIVTDETNAVEWRTIFYITSAIYLFGTVFYGLFASGEVQPWAIETETLKQEEKPKSFSGTENDGFEFEKYS